MTGAVFPGLCARRHVDRRSDIRTNVCARALALQFVPRSRRPPVTRSFHQHSVHVSPLLSRKLSQNYAKKNCDRFVAIDHVKGRRRRNYLTHERTRRASAPRPVGCHLALQSTAEAAAASGRQCTTAPVPLRNPPSVPYRLSRTSVVHTTLHPRVVPVVHACCSLPLVRVSTVRTNGGNPHTYRLVIVVVVRALRSGAVILSRSPFCGVLT